MADNMKVEGKHRLSLHNTFCLEGLDCALWPLWYLYDNFSGNCLYFSFSSLLMNYFERGKIYRDFLI